jgi:hypothetical protein
MFLGGVKLKLDIVIVITTSLDFALTGLIMAGRSEIIVHIGHCKEVLLEMGR